MRANAIVDASPLAVALEPVAIAALVAVPDDVGELDSARSGTATLGSATGAVALVARCWSETPQLVNASRITDAKTRNPRDRRERDS